MLGEIIEWGADRALCRRDMSVASDPYLAHHMLGRRSGSPPDSGDGLAVLPFSFSIEMLAEAADLLSGEDGVPVRLENVRAHRWIALDNGAVTLEIEAVRAADRDGIEVRITEVAGDSHEERRLAVEALVRIADGFADPPDPITPRLDADREPLWQPQDYLDQCLFHGPALFGMRRVLGLGEAGIEVEVEVPPAVEPLAGSPEAVVLPAALLDTLGQLSSYQPVQTGAAHFAMFPFFVESLEWYRRPPRPRARWRARLEVLARDERLVTTRCDFIADDGRVAVRAEGLRNTFESLPQAFLSLLVRPGPDTLLSEPCLEDVPELVARRIDAAALRYLQTSGGIWLRALAHIFLNAEDRRFWYSLPEASPRRAAFLLGRVAATEAIKVRAWDNDAIDLRAGDIDLVAASDGRLVAHVRASEGVCGAAASISECDGWLVAATATDPATRVGVSVERLDARRDLRGLAASLSAAGVAVSAQLDDTRLAALWCAREAVAKAVGAALDEPPQAWRVVPESQREDRLELAVGELLLPVRIHVEEPLVCATCVLPLETAAEAERLLQPGAPLSRSR
jgi:hypothetical protein